MWPLGGDHGKRYDHSAEDPPRRGHPRRGLRAARDRGRDPQGGRPAARGARPGPRGRGQPALRALRAANAAGHGRDPLPAGVGHLRHRGAPPPLERPPAVPGRPARHRPRRDVRGAPGAGGGGGRPGRAARPRGGDRDHGGGGGEHVRRPRGSPGLPPPRRAVPPRHRRGVGQPRAGHPHRRGGRARVRGPPAHRRARHGPPRVFGDAPPHLSRDQGGRPRARAPGDVGAPRAGARGSGAGDLGDGRRVKWRKNRRRRRSVRR